MNFTPKRALANLLLDGKLAGFVESRRVGGMSWADIAFDLRQETDLHVTGESLRSWYPDEAAAS